MKILIRRPLPESLLRDYAHTTKGVVIRETCYSLYPHLRSPRANVVDARPPEGSSSDSGAEVSKMVPMEELERVKEELEKLRAARSFTSMALSGKFHSRVFCFLRSGLLI